MAKVSVVITVLNECSTIDDLVNALINQSHPADEVVIVDGGSTDGTDVRLQIWQTKKLPFALRVLQKVGNRSVGRNFGIEQSSYSLIAITDAGCKPHQDWLEELLAAYQTYQTPVIAGYYDAKPQTAFQKAVVPYVLVMPDRVNPNTFLPATRSMLMTKEAWRAVGAFDERLSDNEDYAFARSLQAKEINIAFAQKAKVRWLPRKNLKQFYTMIYRFARGDVQAGLIRPKVLSIFARYLAFLALLAMALQGLPLGLPALLVALIGYTAWSLGKNYQYVGKAWYWLPVLQYTSDVAVLLGSSVGYFKRLR